MIHGQDMVRFVFLAALVAVSCGKNSEDPEPKRGKDAAPAGPKLPECPEGTTASTSPVEGTTVHFCVGDSGRREGDAVVLSSSGQILKTMKYAKGDLVSVASRR